MQISLSCRFTLLAAWSLTSCADYQFTKPSRKSKYPISFRIVDEQRRPVQEAFIELGSESHAGSPGMTDAQGNVTLWLRNPHATSITIIKDYTVWSFIRHENLDHELLRLDKKHFQDVTDYWVDPSGRIQKRPRARCGGTLD